MEINGPVRFDSGRERLGRRSVIVDHNPYRHTGYSRFTDTCSHNFPSVSLAAIRLFASAIARRNPLIVLIVVNCESPFSNASLTFLRSLHFQNSVGIRSYPFLLTVTMWVYIGRKRVCTKKKNHS